MKGVYIKSANKAGKARRKPLKYLRNNAALYIMLLPAMFALVMFSFIPMYGLYMAFIEYNPLLPSLFDNNVLGLFWFESMFADTALWRMIGNTLILSSLKLLICFPAPIVLALFIHEVNNKVFKRIFQSVSYLPNFIAWITVSGMLMILLDTDSGIFNQIITAFGGDPVSWYSDASKWRMILTLSSLWKSVGWGTIMFLAALTAVDQQLYEAASIDGAGKLRQVFAVTLPAISTTIVITLIFTVGKLFQDDFDQIMSLVGDNPILKSATEVISTRIYSYVLGGAYSEFPISTAYGLVQGLLSLALIIASNVIVKRLGYQGVW